MEEVSPLRLPPLWRLRHVSSWHKVSHHRGHSTSSSQCWDSIWLVHVHAAKVFLSSFVHQSYFVWKTLSPWSQPSPLVLRIFMTPLPHRYLRIKLRTFMKTSHLVLCTPKSLTLWTFSSCEFQGCCHIQQSVSISFFKWYLVLDVLPQIFSFTLPPAPPYLILIV